MSDSSTGERASRLHAHLTLLQQAIVDEEVEQAASISAALPRHRASAENLAHYLRLRREDIHRLQLELGAIGLSSLGRCEGHVRDSLRRVSAWLRGKRGDDPSASTDGALDQERASQILHTNTRALLGPRPANRHVYVMVTAPDAAEVSSTWADEVLEAGADLLRINGAYGSPADWMATVSTFKARASALGKPGRVIVDLPGPKFRGHVRQLEETVVHLRRKKDRFGRTLAPTPVLLVAERRGAADLPVPEPWLPLLEAGDLIELTDSGGRHRRLVVRARTPDGVEATCARSLYFSSHLELVWRRGVDIVAKGRIAAVPPEPAVLRLEIGDAFLLSREESVREESEIPELGFSEPQLLGQVRVGERVLLDDGKVVAIVQAAHSRGLLCRVTHGLKSPARVRSGKGVAFPDSDLAVGQLGPQDDIALDFALEHADGVGVSFVNSAADVAIVGERIRRAGKPGFGMILKLETRSAMQNLSEILFEALKYDPVGLMIARGDLAVELSFERLAEMQEELLWFGEACHLPVVWATEVLDTLAHCGVPTRAEVTDAAMSMRAECVMLNKGLHIASATRMLSDIICRMETHQYKKRALYRKLSLANTAEPRGGEPAAHEATLA